MWDGLYRQETYGRQKVRSVQLQYLSYAYPKVPEVILKSLIERANDVLQPYKDSTTGFPDPSFTLQLPNDVSTSSNLFAVQKMFQAEFQFDVFFESANPVQPLSGKGF
jgi:hypothetical protein